MNRSEKHALGASVLVPIVIATVLLEGPAWWSMLLFLIIPVVVIHLVWRVLRDTSHPIPDLPEGHEWDYLDRPDLAKRSSMAAPE